jgi:hypothetical protein
MPFRRIGEWRYSSTYSLTSALDGGEWSASRPAALPAGKKAPGTHGIGGWVGPRAILDAVVKRKIPSPRRESNRRTPIVQPVAKRYTDIYLTDINQTWRPWTAFNSDPNYQTASKCGNRTIWRKGKWVELKMCVWEMHTEFWSDNLKRGDHVSDIA